jgi:hypothetical protein
VFVLVDGAIELAGFIVLLFEVLPVLLPIEFVAVELVEVEFDGIVFAGVMGGGVFAGMVFVLVGFTLALLAASPQAIPNAPITRTAESAIAFFIWFTNSYSFSKINLSITSFLADQTQPFAPNSFFFEAIDNIVFENILVNSKEVDSRLFFNIIFAKNGRYSDAEHAACPDAQQQINR